ncbi:MAG TPA: hypothetical protein VJ999_03460 [Candidatus Sulfotelmatobacter sp.]|nr:hypothetical protein [Candidatus Sulfotelmatobacter sp.]
MSNSSRIEAATRQHVGAVLTNEQIVELVKMADPNWKGGVYPSDVAYTRTPEGLVPRGKVAYGDGVLEYLAENSFKVLPTDQIVRRPTSRKTKDVAAVPAPTPAPTPKAVKTDARKNGHKKQSRPAGRMPVAPKSKAKDKVASLQ